MESKINFLFAVLAVILIASLALLTYSCSSPATPRYFPRKASLEDACAAADQADKPVVAVFVSEASTPSTKFKRGALAHSRIAAWMTQNAQPILLDMTRADAGDGEAAALRNRYHIAEYPTVLMIRKGREVARLTGAVSYADLLKWLEQHSAPPAPIPGG